MASSSCGAPLRGTGRRHSSPRLDWYVPRNGPQSLKLRWLVRGPIQDGPPPWSPRFGAVASRHRHCSRPMRLKTASPSREALSAALDWLLVRQSTEGWWTAELETNVTMTAEHVLLLRFLGLPLDAIREGAIRHILNQQREDGSWALYFDGPADLSTTIEAYVALKVLGLDPSKESMRRARRVVREQGGLTEARVFTKIWMALFGQYPWIGIPSMPPEMIQLPPALPFNLYDFACWARGTIAGLLIVLAHRPVRDLGCTTLELIVPGTEAAMTRV